MCKMTLALAASVAANVARSSCDRTAISVEVRVPAAASTDINLNKEKSNLLTRSPLATDNQLQRKKRNN